jgi:hypothetical protein
LVACVARESTGCFIKGQLGLYHGTAGLKDRWFAEWRPLTFLSMLSLKEVADAV